MKSLDKIPISLRNEKSIYYYNILKRRWFYRFVKRLFDVFASFILLILLFVPSFIIGTIISITSKGGPFFCQTRVGRYGKKFKIIKFRTMLQNSEGDNHITHKNDFRVTNVGKFLRKYHLDEFPQLLNVLKGQMSFVGTRPEVEQFVVRYKDEYKATLFMRPGITSTASYSYDDEAKYLDKENADLIYINDVLPKKMKCNLLDLEKSNLFWETCILFKTIF